MAGAGESLARARIAQERKEWRKSHPVGFFAKPIKARDGSLDLMTWKCGIPGKEGSIWEGGVYTVFLRFSEEFPTKPPRVNFEPVIWHPNVFQTGDVCLSILKVGQGWKPSLKIEDILRGVQALLSEPNLDDPANFEAACQCENKPEKYNEAIRKQAKKFRSEED